jgi:hypothetical protein
MEYPMTPSTSTTRISDVRELSRLLTAAVVNKRFCKLLLTNPASALASGYNGESFRLDRDDKDLVLSIRAKSLAEFARQIYGEQQIVERPSYPKILYTRSLHTASIGFQAAPI